MIYTKGIHFFFRFLIRYCFLRIIVYRNEKQFQFLRVGTSIGYVHHKLLHCFLEHLLRKQSKMQKQYMKHIQQL